MISQRFDCDWNRLIKLKKINQNKKERTKICTYQGNKKKYIRMVVINDLNIFERVKIGKEIK